MTMTPLSWIIVAVAIVVIGIVVLVANRRLGGMPPVVDDRPGMDLPDEALTGDDLRGVRFAIVSRGYSMGQVDALLDRLSDQLGGAEFQPKSEFETWLDADQAAAPDGQEVVPAVEPGAAEPPITEYQPPVAAEPAIVADQAPAGVAATHADVPAVPPIFRPSSAQATTAEIPVVTEPVLADAPAVTPDSSVLMGAGPVAVEPWAEQVAEHAEVAVASTEIPQPPAPPMDEVPVPLPPEPPVDGGLVPPPPEPPVETPAAVQPAPEIAAPAVAAVPPEVAPLDSEITGDIRTPSPEPPQPPAAPQHQEPPQPAIPPQPPEPPAEIATPPQPPEPPQPMETPQSVTPTPEHSLGFEAQMADLRAKADSLKADSPTE